MTALILIFATLTLLAGIVIVVNPEVIFGTLRNHLDKLALHVLAIVVRLVLGVLLIYQSDTSRYPLAIEIIGWISIAAAIILAVIGRDNFIRSMSWALSKVKPFGRFGGIAALGFGAFLIYAFV